MPKLKQILTFLSIFALILGSSHFYMFTRLNYYLQLTGSQRFFFGSLLTIYSLLTLIHIPVSRILHRKAATLLAWAIYPWMGFALILFVTLVATDAVWFFLKFVPLSHLPEPQSLLQFCFGVVALSVTGILGAIALWNGLRFVKVKPLMIKLDRLPQSLDGTRIVQITDLHIGALIKGDWLQKVVNNVNALKPDLIVITGDLVDGSVEDLRAHVDPLANLEAPMGIYFITGNHEYYSGVEPWCDYIAGLGIRVLRNERVSISAGTDSISFDLAGVDDWGSSHFPGEGPNLKKALRGRDPNKALILLAHQPAAIHEAAEQGVDLQLSGHTHGGQIWPFTYLVYLQQPYTTGLHRYNKQTQVYISSGTGFWGPPMRLGTAAEITHITLRSAA